MVLHLRYVVLAVSTIAGLVAPLATYGQTPTLEEYPFRFVVTGPAAAHSGGEVTYHVAYERANPAPPPAPSFFFSWNPHVGAASFVSSRVTAGGQGVLEPPVDSQFLWGISEPSDSGTVEVVLRIAGDFTGELRASVHVGGTGLTYSPGTVTGVTTQVTAPESPARAPQLPRTGAGTTGGRDGSMALVLLAGAAALAAGLLFVGRRP